MVMRIESNLRLVNDSKRVEDDWWEWSVWVDGPAAEVEAIDHVTYRLHPTFAPPVRRVTDAGSHFKLASEGWGEFLIVGDVSFPDKSSARLEHWVELRDPAAGAASEATQKRPRVFLSRVVRDSSLGRELGEELRRRGVDSATIEDAQGGSNWETELNQQLDSTNMVVPLVSSFESGSTVVEEEIRIALRRGLPVLPVLVGNAPVPEQLTEVPRLELHEQRNVAALADAIAARVKDLVVSEEGSGSENRVDGVTS